MRFAVCALRYVSLRNNPSGTVSGWDGDPGPAGHLIFQDAWLPWLPWRLETFDSETGFRGLFAASGTKRVSRAGESFCCMCY